MHVLVTGGAGFIGTRVVGALTAAGHEVAVLDSLRADVHGDAPTSPDGPPAGPARFVRGDVTDPSAVDAALAGVDAVAHLAAKVGLGVDLDDAPDYARSNDLGTAVLLARTRRAGVGRVVFASSMVVYGEGAYDCEPHGRVAPGPRRRVDLDAGRYEPPCPVCDRPLTPALVAESAPLDPRTVYAATKVHGEHLLGAWCRETSGAGTALRFHNVYGPGMPRDTPYAGVAALFAAAATAGRAPTVLEDGRQRRDFVHVDDVAAAVLAATTAEVEAGVPRAYNVGSGTVTTVGEMAAALAGAAAAPEPEVVGGYRLGDVRHVTADSSRAAAELGWRATTPLRVGVHDLLHEAAK